MAITGKFQADFASFYDAVTKAEVSLKSFEGGAGKVETSLNRVTNSLSGSKLISDATLMTEAVNRVGGASTLTATEMAKVNTKVGEAIEKFKALGQSAPADMQKLHAETMKVAPATSNILSTIAPLAGAFGIAFSVGGVVSFGREIMNDADALVKLADKTGIAIEPLQRLKYAAEQSGNSFDQVTSAITMMQKRIAGGDDSAIGALSRLGISLSDFKAMSPDQQFIAIATEVAKIQDPMERVKVATELFGRAGAEILPTLIADMKRLGDQAAVMSEGATRAFDDIGDAANRVGGLVKAGIGNAFEFAIDNVARLAEAAKHLTDGELVRMAAALGGLATEALPKMPPALGSVKKSIDDVALSAAEYDRVNKELTESVKAQIETALSPLKRAQDALFSRDIIDRANTYVEALGGIGNITKLTEEKKKELTRAIEGALAAYKALGEQAPPEMQKIVAATFDLNAEVTKLHEKSLPAFAGLLTNVDRTLDPLPPKVEAFRSGLVFTAETIETVAAPALERLNEQVKATAQSFSDAMAMVSAGLGTMGGSFANPYALAPGATPAEQAARARELGGVIRYDDYGNPYVHVPGRNNPGTPTYTPRRLAGGGPISAGETAWVGERGPELFTPSSAGMISANGSGGWVNNITVNTVMGNGLEIARIVKQAVVDAARAQGTRLPSRA